MENDRALSTLKHSINMIKSLNMDIVAEGLETKDQSQALQGMGCDYLQGYYLIQSPFRLIPFFLLLLFSKAHKLFHF